MEKTNFEKLDIYQLAERIADSIWEIALSWNSLAQDTVGKQIIRSSDSIGANIAEGSGRGTAADNRRFLRMARGSLYETRHWLRRAHKRKLLSEMQITVLSPLIAELTPKLNSYIRKVDSSVVGKRKGKTQDQES
jgi:four helix bundle protein